MFYLQDIQEAHAGQIVAVFGVDCASGFTPLYVLNCEEIVSNWSFASSQERWEDSFWLN